MLRVLHYQRRKRPYGNFSLEFMFNDVRERLGKECRFDKRISPFHSNGILGRLRIVRDVSRFHSGIAVTHITGDINFAVMGTPRDTSILTILDCGFLNAKRFLKRTLLKLLWLNYPVYWSRTITTISEKARDEIVLFTGCDPKKVVVIPVAISEKFTSLRSDFNTQEPRILQIGTAENKNILRLVDAIQGIKCILCIVGKISPDLQSKLVENKIRYENFTELSLDEVVLQYNRSDLISFASTYEGFGMPIIEAQSVGRPVVTSNLSSMPEVAGDAACLVDPYDCDSIRTGILRVISDRVYRTGLIERGFENAKRFNPDVIASNYFDLYRRVAEELQIVQSK